MRIAYVEDNVANLALVERVARMNQHTIVSFSEGEVAIQELVRQKFDLILMDIELAGEMGGLQVVQHLRGQGITTPIVAVTAYAMMGDRERFLEAGCNDYLPKPLPIAEFLVLLAKYDTAKQDTQAASPVAPVAAVSPTPVSQATPPATPVPVAPAAAVSPAPQATPPVTPAPVAPAAAVSPTPAPQATPPADAKPVVAVTSSPADSTPAVSPTPAPVQPEPVQPTPTPAPVASVTPAQPPAPMPPLREEDTATKPIPWLASIRAAARANNNAANAASSSKPTDAATVPADAPAAPTQKDTPPLPDSEPVPDQPAPSNDVPPTRVP